MTTTLWRNARLATLAEASGWGLDRARRAAGRRRHASPGSAPRPTCRRRCAVDAEHDLGGALVTPGLVDCHTHLVYGGQRAREFELRLEGASYEEIARAGGGIRSTVAATRAASDETPVRRAPAQRALALMAEGVTTLEIKSGYGLAARARGALPARRAPARPRAAARRCARPASRRTRCRPSSRAAPTTTSTPSAPGCRRCTPRGLVDAVDALLRPHRLHAGADAARLRGRARARPAGQAARRAAQRPGRRRAGRRVRRAVVRPPRVPERRRRARRWPRPARVAVLLPGAFYFLRETQLPPVAALRAAGVPIAIATDHNPGSSPTLSPLLMLNMACTLFRLTPEEALRGVTVNARARARPRRPRHARRRPARRLRRLGRRASERAGLLVRPQPVRARRRRRRGTGVEPMSGARSSRCSAARRRCSSACRTSAPRSPDDLAPALVPRALARRGHRLAPRPRSTPSRASSARACSCRATRATSIDLNRPPENTPMYPGANNTELCPTRFFTGEPLYRDGRVPDERRDRAARASATGGRTTTRSPPSSRG